MIRVLFFRRLPKFDWISFWIVDSCEDAYFFGRNVPFITFLNDDIF